MDIIPHNELTEEQLCQLKGCYEALQASLNEISQYVELTGMNPDAPQCDSIIALIDLLMVDTKLTKALLLYEDTEELLKKTKDYVLHARAYEEARQRVDALFRVDVMSLDVETFQQRWEQMEKKGFFSAFIEKFSLMRQIRAFVLQGKKLEKEQVAPIVE